MEIHELNTFTGTLGVTDYFATDNGRDTSKVSAEAMLGPLNQRIDNIITSPAPTQQEIIDARLGADGVTYISLGDAIRGQADWLNGEIDDLESNIEADENLLNIVVADTSYNEATPQGQAINNTNRWFLNGSAYGYIEKVSLRCKATNGNIRIEGWEVSNGVLTKAFEKNVQSYIANALNEFPINYKANNPVMVSVVPDSNLVAQITDTSAGFNAYRTTDLTSQTLNLSSLVTFTGLNVIGFISYRHKGASDSSENVLTVSPSGNCNYTNIAAAVSAASDGDVIIVYPGTYPEPIEAWGKTVSIIGIDKETCIITNDTGNYATPAVEIDSGRIANLTIISTGANPTTIPSDTSNYMRDYSIHVDHAHAEGKTLIIEDCIIRNNHRTALGMGCYANNTVIVRNCDLWADKPPADIVQPLWNKRGVLYFHNRQPSDYFSNVTGQKMRFINNTMYCEDIIAVYIGDTCQGVDMDGHGWINEMEVEFINNMICAKYANGSYKTSSDGVATPTAFSNDSVISGTGFTQYLKLSSISYGNNIAYLNA